ncbi:MAG: aminoglycoside phosphotransferase [Pseudonocardiaceae bacterium]
MSIESDADREWLGWLSGLLKTGVEAFDVHLAGEVVPGLRGRTVGCPVSAGARDWWMRVVTEPAGWGHGPAWTGNSDANQITGVPRPRVVRTTEWDEAGRRVRAELMTLAPGSAIASEIVLREPVELDGSWWDQLHSSLDVLARVSTERVCLAPELLRLRILSVFGVAVDLNPLAWVTAHGDLHWANLTNPGCWILDWESWGAAPAGYDAALLRAASVLQPAIAQQVQAEFADVLDGPAGAVAGLAAAAKLLRLVEHGEHPDLAAPLHHHARELVRTYFGQT